LRRLFFAGTDVSSTVLTLLYQQANVEIYWDDREWLYVDWIGLQSVDNIYTGSDQILRLLQLKSAEAVLNDNTHLKGIWIGAAERIGREWFPNMVRAGLKRFAWVQSPSALSHVSMEETLRFAPPRVAQVFFTRGEAEAWLLWRSSMAAKRKSGQIALPGRDT
jgi:hypothetical protein